MSNEKEINKTAVKGVGEIIETLIHHGDCSFWACEGYYQKDGKLIKRIKSMITCGRCCAISQANNLYKKLSGNFYQPKINQ